MDTSLPVSDFVTANGIHLHYLDWGGHGPALLFLAGLHCSAYIFSQFAPRFMDQFHVMALTRRGHGDSDYPESGYDIDTLTEDIRQFMDSLQIDRAILVGHSLAGIELSHFAALHHERVLKLVLLDAAYDRASPAFKAMQEKNPLRSIQPPGANDHYYSIDDYAAFLKRAYPSLALIWNEVLDVEVVHWVKQTPEGKVVDKMSDAIGKAIQATLNSYRLEYAKIQSPVLSFFALPDSAYYLSTDFMSEEQQAQVIEFIDTVLNPYYREWIEQFRRTVLHARIVEILHGHHYCFIMHEELVFEEMRKFLLD